MNLTIDAQGNLHNAAGRFAEQQRTAPTSLLEEVPEIQTPSEDAVRVATMQVELRAGVREVSDSVAGTIAADAVTHLPEGSPSDYPMLSLVAADPSAFGTDDEKVALLHIELTRLYGHYAVPPTRRDRINMLYTWAVYGGDND